jgi:hypothetical protein
VARKSRNGGLNRRQLSTTERIAAVFGPACELPIWILFLRPRATGRIEFSARLLLLQFRIFQEARELVPQGKHVVAGLTKISRQSSQFVQFSRLPSGRSPDSETSSPREPSLVPRSDQCSWTEHPGIAGTSFRILRLVRNRFLLGCLRKQSEEEN